MRSRLLTLAVAVLTALGLAVVPLGQVAEAEEPAQHQGKPLTVMTRNLYLGADIDKPVLAAKAAEAPQPGDTPAIVTARVVTALANATHQARAIVDQTNFNVRARLLAKELKKRKPDLVGLQEVALWRHGPYEPGAIGVPNATTVDYDFLAILLKALRKNGLHYKAVQVGDRADVEVPSFTGTFSDPGPGAQDVRLTMRDVILKRAKNDVKVLDSGSALYSTNLALTGAGRSFNFARGYNWVDVRHGSKRFRFINTHLEAFSSDIALAQAQQLVANAPSATGTNVIVCDCNSDPLNHSVKTSIGDTQPRSAPYDFITGHNFVDEWLRWKPANQGWTSGLSETVNDPDASGFDHRIDMVFARRAGAAGGGLRVDRGWVTGTKVTDRDPATGLWPSDHGGVVLRLRGL